MFVNGKLANATIRLKTGLRPAIAWAQMLRNVGS
jgi:hypothetical protein